MTRFLVLLSALRKVVAFAHRPKIILSSCSALLVFFAIVMSSPSSVQGRTLEVGETKSYKLLSEALRDAGEGDTVRLDAGEYFDCAFVRANNLVIEGAGPDGAAVITDKPCGGKALLVISGNDVTIRNLTLTRARVPDGNGAGIRAEGNGLTMESVKFINNQDGLLAGDLPGGTIRFVDCVFANNGSAAGQHPLHAIAVGQIGLLQVERTRFVGTRGESDIRSDAARTDLRDNSIEADPGGRTRYLVEVGQGRGLKMEGNKLQIADRTSPPMAAVLILADGGAGAGRPLFRNNSVINDSKAAPPYVQSWGGEAPVMEGNTLVRFDVALSYDGRMRHILGNMYRAVRRFIGWVHWNLCSAI